ncbi:amidohydrolase [Sphingomonas sp. ERG5]|uniref:amidohydrolase n=1 Tax=Sphingomonas sp. ERG5 TaxID=1381597 RepID=UPI00054C39FC|nr:amidohydrolase [Sphingomonas sp. ERG5]
MIDRRQFIGASAAMMLASPLLAAAPGLDIALVNARVWTGRREHAAVTAVGIIGERIAAVGAGPVRAATTRATRVIDLDGAFLSPAFIDNHTHFLRGAAMLRQPSLRDAKTPAAFAERVAAAGRLLKPGQWVEGGYWDEQLWGGELPTRAWIDAVTPDHPVAVSRLDLHMILLNSVALKIAGIDRNTVPPEGGVIVRDTAGEPTGILKDNAAWLAERAIPKLDHAGIEDILRGGIAEGLSKGIAQAHSPEIDWSMYEALRRLGAKGRPDMRFYSFVPIADWEKMAAIVAAEGKGDDWIRWGGVKGLMDGSLGSRTALFRDPYSDAPDTRGVRVTPRADIAKWVAAADAHRMPVTVHAIGDEANDELLDIYADVARVNGKRDRRFRIEHAQHLSPAAIPRFAKQEVIASVQPYHAIDDGRWAVKRIGEARLRGTYAFKSLLDAGARVTFGSDWPVAPFDPITGIHAAVTRATIDGLNPNGWLPDQKIAVEQALTAYTSANAFAGFQDDRLGLIAPGYLADLTILDADPRSVPAADIARIRVLRTFVGGTQHFGPQSG